MAIGWAIVGIGAHADTVMAPAMNKIKDCKLVAVYSRDMGRASAFAAKHGAGRAYDSLDGLLRDPAVEVVYVASPYFLHKEQTIGAAKAGKHVLCEKPMALTIADCEEMIETCEKHGVKLEIGVHMRHHPAHAEMRRQIQAGEVGKVLLTTAQLASGVTGQAYTPPRGGLQAWRNDPALAVGGTIMQAGSHVFDLLRFLLGQEVTEVSAFGDEGIPEAPVDQIDTVMLQFDQSAYGVVVCSRIIPNAPREVVVYGSECCLKATGTAATTFDGTLERIRDTVTTRQSYSMGNPYVNELESFNRYVQGKGEAVASGRDGLRALQVNLAAIESRRTKRAVPISIR